MSQIYPDWVERVLGEWTPLVGRQTNLPYFKAMMDILRKERQLYTVFPPAEMTTRALLMTPPDAVKVVILGQDPYHTPGMADGLAFSCARARGLGLPIPPSLRNIFREIERDLDILDLTPDPDLGRWAKQGVLLLNTTLTVRQGLPGSHGNIGWKTFTAELIRALCLHRQNSPIVFMFWGAHAAEYDRLVCAPHHVLLSSHPSPLSVRKGFEGCRHFSQANRFLTANNQSPIDWA